MTDRFWPILPALFLGLVLGWALPLFERDDAGRTPDRDFHHRIESFQPTCEQLRSVELHGPVGHGNETVLIQTQPDYFYVIGLSLRDGQPPMTTWWGADRSSTLDQACAGR